MLLARLRVPSIIVGIRHSRSPGRGLLAALDILILIYFPDMFINIISRRSFCHHFWGIVVVFCVHAGGQLLDFAQVELLAVSAKSAQPLHMVIFFVILLLDGERHSEFVIEIVVEVHWLLDVFRDVRRIEGLERVDQLARMLYIRLIRFILCCCLLRLKFL